MRAISISVKEKKDVSQYTVKWQKNPGGEELQCKSCEYPRPELIQRLADFGEFIPIITLIPKEKIRWIVITGATYVYEDKNAFEGLAVGVMMELANGHILEFRTPIKRLNKENPDLEQSTNWEDRYTKLAIELEKEILLYAKGDRAQGVLFEDKAAEDGKNQEEL